MKNRDKYFVVLGLCDYANAEKRSERFRIVANRCERLQMGSGRIRLRPLGGRDRLRQVDALVGGAPSKPNLGEKVVAAIEWVDGTVIDSVMQVLPKE